MPTTNRTASHQRASRLEPGRLFAGRYIVERILAVTAMSVIYRARDGRQLVVIKQLLNKPGLSSARRANAVARFYREAQLLKSLDHPQLPRFKGAFRFRENYFIVTTFEEGLRLDQWISGGMIDLPTALTMIEQLGVVLSYLHHQQPPVIHADIKPANLILTRDGRVVLLDLGLSRQVISGQCDPDPAGTPPYTPPEQWRGEPLDERSDIYAFGVLIGELLAGVDDGELARAVIERATAPQRDERYNTVEQLLQSLRPLLLGVVFYGRSTHCSTEQRRVLNAHALAPGSFNSVGVGSISWAQARVRRLWTGLFVAGVLLGLLAILLLMIGIALWDVSGRMG